MSRLSEIIILILQFLKEHNLKETIHILEQESGVFFNMKHFEEAVLAGEWEKAERYLSGFTKLDDNQISKKIFFMIRRNKYIETLQRHDVSKACEILMKDLKVFSEVDEGLFKELTQLLTLEDFREKAKLSKYIDTRSARILAINELRKLIKANPLFEDILQFPDMKESRLKTLLNQSLHWQHMRCKNPRSQPEFKSLFFDHSCPQASEAIMPSPAPPPIKLTSKSSPSPMNPIAKPTTMNMTAKPVPSWLNLVANPVLPTMNPIAKPSPQIEKISPPPMNPIAKPAPRPMKVNSKHACPTMNLTAKPVPLMKLPMNPTAKLSGFPLIRPPEPAADDGSTKVAAEIPSRMAPYRTSCEFTGQVPSNAPPPKPRPAISAADFDKPIELDVPPITASLLNVIYQQILIMGLRNEVLRENLMRYCRNGAPISNRIHALLKSFQERYFLF
ncbi:uncharacterized protein A4U43_C01F1300 [Asparagus officinalis]|uniref:CTLH domain-containing protein n=1 Tax=Asparagus officinalis TaxID=4686 RepID=A0A5P1FKU5_ASPOF|nr:uncharacterized protein A4U43_C01F1300 [Asparagus officinalis]